MLDHITQARALVDTSYTGYDVLKPWFLGPITGKIDARDKGRRLAPVGHDCATSAEDCRGYQEIALPPFLDRNKKDAFVDVDRCEGEPRPGISAGSMAGIRFAHPQARIEHCHNTIILLGGNISTQD